MSDLQFIFCHGLSGWGEYDKKYKKSPYWGMKTGDVLAKLRNAGYRCCAASVSPHGSAWDRACELYAQLAGTKVDYGRAHSMKNNHKRYGTDYTGRPLIKTFNDDTRIVLIGHSFGGATIRLLSQLMADGDEEERQETHPLDLSPLFKGGMEKRIFAIVTIAAPSNGTVSYDMHKDPNFDTSDVGLSWKYEMLAAVMRMSTKVKKDGRNENDFADYDMEIDHATALNKRIRTLPDTYYFSQPCVSTVIQEDGTSYPDLEITEAMFARSSVLIGKYKGVTAGGIEVDESWRPNDGLVNTLSARAPLNAPQKEFDPDHIEKGIWNVFPDYHGDHSSLQGGYTINRDPYPFYENLLSIISGLE
jgi:triacylglycerol esterase/lipase EstA (alpha/beta hydrolase family)